MAIANVALVIVVIHDKRSAVRSSNSEIYLSTVPTDWVPISFTHRRCLAFKAKAEKNSFVDGQQHAMNPLHHF